MISQAQIAEAMRNTDAISEEHEDMPRFWRERRVDADGLVHCSMQHGLRQVMMLKGINPNQSHPVAVPTTKADQVMVTKFAAAFMAGFAAAWEIARKEKSL